ncbi:hypothetical protein AX14_000444 [Amanita brunnescens Koide BX004]|nr:hypothetical protein AX14_000444 [Amanita brunnescens Koide BX004]
MTRKRKAADFPISVSRKRQNTKPSANQNHLQLARHVLECMAAASRHYATGVFVDRFNISLWYYDRAIVARSAIFNFEDQPAILALVLYALRSCTPQQAGLNPFIIPASEPCPTNIDELFKTSTSATQSKDDQIVLVREDGSTVRFRITGERLFVNRCLLGRGTQVYPVQAIDGTAPDVEQVLKMIWPDDQRIREADVIRKLREAMPEIAQHLPDVICSSDMTVEQLRLPRHLLGINVAEDLERRLHAIVMSRYKALWNVDSVEEFQDVFVDCVECHYAAYRQGRVLHRDLSINNLMCDKQSTRYIGILSDWDLASLIDDRNAVIASNAKHRTGTIPFMSIHLLKSSPPHRYCHDLESFFYILIWAAFQKWNDSNLLDAAEPKLNYLCNPSRLTPFVSDDFKTLLVTWIKALRELFYNVYIKNNAELDMDFDDAVWSQVVLERLEKNITFEAFMSAIGRKPRYAYT